MSDNSTVVAFNHYSQRLRREVASLPRPVEAQEHGSTRGHFPVIQATALTFDHHLQIGSDSGVTPPRTRYLQSSRTLRPLPETWRTSDLDCRNSFHAGTSLLTTSSASALSRKPLLDAHQKDGLPSGANLGQQRVRELHAFSHVVSRHRDESEVTLLFFPNSSLRLKSRDVPTRPLEPSTSRP